MEVMELDAAAGLGFADSLDSRACALNGSDGFIPFVIFVSLVPYTLPRT